MSVTSIFDALTKNDLPRSLQIFTPELLLCGTIVALLLVRLVGQERKVLPAWVALLGSLIGFVAVFTQFMYVVQVGPDVGGPIGTLYNWFHLTPNGVGEIGTPYFTGLLIHDQFGLFFRLGLSLFLVLVIALTILTGIPDNEDGPDFYTLLIGSAVGMLLAAAANHLLMVFVAVEMMSVPSYAMVGFLKGKRQSSEAALKYVVYGAGAAGVMLYGISLLAGLFGTGDLSQLGERFTFLMEGETFGLKSPTSVTVVLGVMMVMSGLAFKLSLVPFHFWAPDAFEGAAPEVGGYLSVASKAAAFALLVRFGLAFTGNSAVTRELCLFLGLGLGVVASLSMTLGNLAAYTQTNLKRLLAYSTIAHAGYMVLAVSSLLVINSAVAGTAGYDRLAKYTVTFGGGGDVVANASARALEGLMYYLAVYLFMNLAAFAIVALIRNETYREDIDAYNGLFYANPATKVLCICLALSFFSLVGLPPLGGFFAKMMIFFSTFGAGYVHWLMWVILGIAGLNTAFSLFYYLRVIKAMFFAAPAEDRRPVRTPGLVGAYVALVTLPVLMLGMPLLPIKPLMLQESLSSTAFRVAASLFGG
ncbi:MAG: NADH-quinone oxidoreductase subunit N [Planctomycetaceae bacterium]